MGKKNCPQLTTDITHGTEALRGHDTSASLWCELLQQRPHTQNKVPNLCARADDGGWGSAVSPSFLATFDLFAAAVPPGPPLGFLRLPVAGSCELPLA
jgi:hypothetical protein